MSRSSAADRLVLEGVVDDVIAGRIDVLDWARAVRERKAVGSAPRGYRHPVRVSAEFLSAVSDAARMKGMSVGEFMDTLVPTLRRRYRNAIFKEARRLG